MRYLSICSGIESASVAWHPLGWQATAFSEIEPFPCAVLKHHYPDIPNWGDANEYGRWPDATFDVLVGGTPCQSFSVAGLRKGLADPRGSLMLDYLAIAGRYRPPWVIWENVPGVLSLDGGQAFGTFLRGLAEFGYHAAWRVLDAQYVRVDGLERAVAQRRRRVFVVGYSGDWRPPAAVLFERESLCGNSAPSRTAGQGTAHATAPSLTGSSRGVERVGDPRGQDPVVAWALQERDHKGADSSTKDGHLIVADPIIAGEDKTYSLAGNNPRPRNIIPVLEADARAGREGHEDKDGIGIGEPGDPMYSLQARKQHAVLAFDETQITSKTNRSEPRDQAPTLAETARPPSVAFKPSHFTRDKDGAPSETMPPLTKETDKGDQDPVLLQSARVRRLMPVECERLQGFPDHYTLVLHRGKAAADGPRYKALGNAMAVNVMRWIGQRIDLVNGLL